jgi:hypothetical protein
MGTAAFAGRGRYWLRSMGHGLTQINTDSFFSIEAFTDFLRDDVACVMTEGTLEVTRLEAEVGQDGRFEGTFSGTLTCQIKGMPDTITVTNGRFQGLEIPHDNES